MSWVLAVRENKPYFEFTEFFLAKFVPKITFKIKIKTYVVWATSRNILWGLPRTMGCLSAAVTTACTTTPVPVYGTEIVRYMKI